MREVETLWHRLVCINVEFLTVLLRRLQQNVQIRGGISLRGEPQPHRRPTILVFDEIDSLFAQVVVDVYPLGVAGVCHPMVAHEDDIDNICEVTGLQSRMEVSCENVDGFQRILLGL